MWNKAASFIRYIKGDQVPKHTARVRVETFYPHATGNDLFKQVSPLWVWMHLVTVYEDNRKWAFMRRYDPAV